MPQHLSTWNLLGPTLPFISFLPALVLTHLTFTTGHALIFYPLHCLAAFLLTPLFLVQGLLILLFSATTLLLCLPLVPPSSFTSSVTSHYYYSFSTIQDPTTVINTNLLAIPYQPSNWCYIYTPPSLGNQQLPYPVCIYLGN